MRDAEGVFLTGAYLLENEPPPGFDLLPCSVIMRRKVICLRESEKASAIHSLLTSSSHNGFPIIDAGESGCDRVFAGMIKRAKLMELA